MIDSGKNSSWLTQFSVGAPNRRPATWSRVPFRMCRKLVSRRKRHPYRWSRSSARPASVEAIVGCWSRRLQGWLEFNAGHPVKQEEQPCFVGLSLLWQQSF